MVARANTEAERLMAGDGATAAALGMRLLKPRHDEFREKSQALERRTSAHRHIVKPRRPAQFAHELLVERAAGCRAHPCRDAVAVENDDSTRRRGARPAA